MKTEEFLSSFKEIDERNLISLIVYGPSAQDPDSGKAELVQLLVLVENLNTDYLGKYAKTVKKWTRSYHPFPKLFTKERFLNSADVFPIECHAIKQNYKVLYGDDLVAELDVSNENLRHQLESEFKGKLMQLRESFMVYMNDSGNLKRVLELSKVTFESLLVSYLILLDEDVPSDNDAVLKLLEEKTDLDFSSIREISKLVDGSLKADKTQLHELFAAFLGLMEKMADKADAHSD